MPDLFWLADLGRASTEAVWLPLAVWSVVALAAESGLRLGRAGAPLALPVRGAVLAALPLSVAVPTAFRALAPDAALAVADVVPAVIWLPAIDVGGPAPDVVASGPSPVGVALGLAVLAALALAGVRLVQFGRAVVAASQTRRRLPGAGPEAQRAVDDARDRLGVARPVRAAQAPAGAAPFTVGWRAPLVALPSDLGADALEVAAVHEVAHVRRSDFAWHAAQRLVTSVFAAHPLAGALGRGLDLDRERAADAAVLAACPDRRRAYADLLFSYASLPAPALALGATRGSSSLKTRIDAMTRPLSPTRNRHLARLGRALGLVALVAVVAATTAMGPADSSRLGAETTEDGLRIDRLRLHTAEDGTPESLDLYLADGATEADARAAAAHADSDESDAVPMPLRVHYDGAVLTRGIRLGRGVTSFGRVSVGLDRSPARTVGPAVGRLARRDTTDVVEVAEVQPQLIGGLEGVAERLVYPELQRRAGVEGRTVVQFVVSTEGAVTDLEVVRSSGNDGLDRAAVDVMRTARFVPGQQDGRPVRVRFAVPITFRLPNDGAARPSPPGSAEVGEAVTVRRSVPDPDDSNVFGVVDEMPELVGGLAGLQERVQYPPLAREAGIEGQVVVQFVVSEVGRVEDAVALRSPHPMLSEAALAAVRGATFRPGRNAGQPVKTRFAVPITFRLPAGDGQDQGQRIDRRDDRRDGSRRDRPAPERGLRTRIGFDLEGNRLPVRYAGVDLSRLSDGSRQAFVNTYNGIPEIYRRHGQAAGDVEVRYVIDDRGRASQAEYVRGERSMMDLASFLVGTLELAADARPGPGGSSAGTLRIWYLGEG